MAGSRDFPRRKEDFDNDDRIAFSRADNKYILEDEDGTEWEWTEETGEGRWVPVIAEEDIAQQQRAYMSQSAEAEDGETAEEQFRKKKRKLLEEAKAKEEPSKKQRAEKPNTAIYITSLPLDVTVEEIDAKFSRYGLIMEEVDSDNKRIKLYTDDEGNPKGDALVVYFKPESVQLAIQMEDESDFRWGEKGPDGPMRVKQADSSYKRTAATKTAAPQPVRAKKGSDKQKIIEKTQKLNQRLADWSEDEDGGALLNAEVKNEVKKESRWAKNVVLKHMFTVEGLAAEMKEDPSTKEDLLEDVKDQCVASGDVTEMMLWDLEPEGVITVKFATAEAAADCARRLNGKGFDGRTVEAYVPKTRENFKRSKPDSDDEEEKKRIEGFAQFIENQA